MRLKVFLKIHASVVNSYSQCLHNSFNFTALITELDRAGTWTCHACDSHAFHGALILFNFCVLCHIVFVIIVLLVTWLVAGENQAPIIAAVTSTGFVNNDQNTLIWYDMSVACPGMRLIREQWPEYTHLVWYECRLSRYEIVNECYLFDCGMSVSCPLLELTFIQVF